MHLCSDCSVSDLSLHGRCISRSSTIFYKSCHFTVIVRRRHSTKQKVAQGKCTLHFVCFNGVVCSNTLFSNTSVSATSLTFRVNSTFKGSRTPRLVEHFWVPVLGASCTNKLLVGTLRPSRLLALGCCSLTVVVSLRAIIASQLRPGGEVVI